MPTATAPTKTQRTRQTILRAADECFREFGFDAAKSAEIARRAGVAEGTIFMHFGNKDGLLTAVTAGFYELLQAEAEATLPTSRDAATRLRHLVDGWAARIEADWGLIRVFAQRSNIDPNSELSETITALNRRYTRLFISVINELKSEDALPHHLPSSLIRDIIFGTLEHTARGQDLAGRPIKARPKAKQMLNLLLKTVPDQAGGPDRPLGALETKLDRVLELLDPSQSGAQPTPGN